MEGVTMEEKIGLDAIKKVVAEIKEITKQVKDAAEDGINLEDVKVLPELLKNAGELIQALKASKEEIQDIEKEEWKELAVEAIDLVTFLVELFGKVEAAEGQKYGIDAIKDCISVCKELAKIIKEILADGKIGLGDIKELPQLLKEMNTLFACIKLTGPELKDLDTKEIKEIALESIELVLFVIALLGVSVK